MYFFPSHRYFVLEAWKPTRRCEEIDEKNVRKKMINHLIHNHPELTTHVRVKMFMHAYSEVFDALIN